jgi:hypothetical protein
VWEADARPEDLEPVVRGWGLDFALAAFDIYRFESDPAIVYTEGYGSAHPTANPVTIKDCPGA